MMTISMMWKSVVIPFSPDGCLMIKAQNQRSPKTLDNSFKTVKNVKYTGVVGDDNYYGKKIAFDQLQ